MTQTSRRFLWLAALTALLSVLVHGYLYNQHLALQSGEYTRSLCDINEKFDCSAVSASKYAVFFGVPVALWGLIANFMFLVSLSLVAMSSDDGKPAARRTSWVIALIIMLGTVVMGGISLLLISKFCLFCILAYVFSLLTALFTWLAFKNDGVSSVPRVAELKPLFTMAAVGLLAGFVIHSSMKSAYNPNAEANERAEATFVADWQAAPVQDIKLVDPLVIGASVETAKLTLVEFADFRCIHCKHAAPVLHAFMASHPDVRLEFQPWPLDGECNASLNQTNGASCLLARAVWCAQKLNQQGWAAHNFIYDQPEIYAKVDQVRAALPDIAKAAQVAPDAMKTCADSDDAKAVVRKQAEAGSALNLQGTPTIYANKKVLSGGQSLPILQRAYQTL